MTRISGRAFLIVLIALLPSIMCGCSALLATSGVLGPGTLYVPQTRAEVRDQFGEADETGTCPDDRVVERRWVRQRVEWISRSCQSSSVADAALCGGIQGAYWGSLGLVDIFFLPVIAYRSERAKLHYAFIYDNEDRVVYRYDLEVPALARFADVTRPLSEALYAQLADGKCNTWTACLTDYAQEARKRAACVGYTLGAEDEQQFERIFAIGEAMDTSRVSPEAALPNLQVAGAVRRPQKVVGPRLGEPAADPRPVPPWE